MTTVNAVLDLNPPAPGRARAAAGSLSAGSESARARCGIRVGERQRHSLASAESCPGRARGPRPGSPALAAAAAARVYSNWFTRPLAKAARIKLVDSPANLIK